MKFCVTGIIIGISLAAAAVKFAKGCTSSGRGRAKMLGISDTGPPITISDDAAVAQIRRNSEFDGEFDDFEVLSPLSPLQVATCA